MPGKLIPSILMASLAFLDVCLAQDDNFRSELIPLYYAKKLDVLVEKVPEDLKEAGLDEKQLKTDAELKLRLADLEITPNADSYLYVQVGGIKCGDLGYAFSVSLSFKQPAMLLRAAENMLQFSEKDNAVYIWWQGIGNLDPKFIMGFNFRTFDTWEKGTVGYLGSGRDVDRDIRESVKDLVDAFINDLLASRQQLKELMEKYAPPDSTREQQLKTK